MNPDIEGTVPPIDDGDGHLVALRRTGDAHRIDRFTDDLTFDAVGRDPLVPR